MQRESRKDGTGRGMVAVRGQPSACLDDQAAYGEDRARRADYWTVDPL